MCSFLISSHLISYKVLYLCNLTSLDEIFLKEQFGNIKTGNQRTDKMVKPNIGQKDKQCYIIMSKYNEFISYTQRVQNVELELRMKFLTKRCLFFLLDMQMFLLDRRYFDLIELRLDRSFLLFLSTC